MIGPDIPAHLLPQVSSLEQDEPSDSEGPQPAPSIGPQIPESIGPQIPQSLSPARRVSTATPAKEEEDDEDDDDDDDDYAPALPPDLAVARAKKIQGPSFPPSIAGPSYDDDDDDDVGPRPLPQGVILEEKDGVQEFLEREERRRKNLEVRLHGLYFALPRINSCLPRPNSRFSGPCS